MAKKMPGMTPGEARAADLMERLFEWVTAELQAEEVARTAGEIMGPDGPMPMGMPLVIALNAVHARISLDFHGGNHVPVLEEFGEAVQGVLSSPEYAEARRALKLKNMPTTGGVQ